MDEFKIVEKELGFVVEIEETVSVFKMATFMGRDLNAIKEYIKKNRVKETEVPYSRYVDIDWDSQINNSGFKNFIQIFTKKWHFFCGIATETKLESSNNIISRNHKNKTYVTGVHLGPYQNVGKTYSEMYKWLTAQGCKALPESIEFYNNDPNEVTKEELETIVYIPVVPNQIKEN